jgi:hypothetical protein
VKSVFDIRSFFLKSNAANYINTAMLMRHALAFGAYMITIVLYFASLCYWGWVQTASAYDWVMITGVVFNAGSVFSQVLLCNIIADLGMKPKEPTERGTRASNPCDVTEVTISDFDEDAELQANIWNSLVRKQEDSGPGGNIFLISGESFSSSKRASMKKSLLFCDKNSAAGSIQ